MSAEDSAWLNTNVLIGYTSERGHAWHYRASAQGFEPNHYEGAVPVADVERRLFHWTPVVGDVAAQVVLGGRARFLPDERHQAIVRPDTGAVLGVVSPSYTIHDYREWLLGNVSALLGTAGVASAGLLEGGAKAWVQVEVPQSLTTAQGVEFRPFLTATTSLDGTTPTTYLTGAQVVVCDNTLRAALREKDARTLRIRHSTRSQLRLHDAREALDLLEATGEAFAHQVAQQCATRVSDEDWQRFLVARFPLRNAHRFRKHPQFDKRAALSNLWHSDERVAPWKGTAYGVVAAVNTYEHHYAEGRPGRGRAERNALRAVGDRFSELDVATTTLLREVLNL